MKSIHFKAWALMATTVFLLAQTGCKEETGTNTAQVQEQTYEGKLQSLGKTTLRGKATHILRVEEGTVIYVYSEDYDLDNPTYLEKTIQVSGVVFPLNEERPEQTIMRIDEIQLNSSASETTEEAHRVRYSNENLGFSMLYRNDWTVEESSLDVKFIAPEQDMIRVTTQDNLQNLEIEEWFKQYVHLDTATDMPYTKSNVGPKQIPAIESLKENSKSFYIQDEGQVFIVTHESVSETHRDDYEMLFAEMIYSFDIEAAIGPDYSEKVSKFNDQLNELIPTPGNWTATVYEFVEPNYIYIHYEDAFTEEKGRILIKENEENTVETLAVFKPGEYVDWELVSGVDEAKGKNKTVVNATSGNTMVVAEGYRWFESETHGFQMQYPSSWYYARSGNEFYFSDQPADKTNTLVTLIVLDHATEEYKEEINGDNLRIDIPGNEKTSFELKTTTLYQIQVEIMAKSLLTTEN